MHSTTRHIPQYGILATYAPRLMVTLELHIKRRSNAPFMLSTVMHTPHYPQHVI